VITAHEPSRLARQADLLTTSSNQSLLQPTKDNKVRRKVGIKKTVLEVRNKGKDRDSSSNGEVGRAPVLKGVLRHHSSGSSSVKSDRSQLVDLVVEDDVAEEIEKVRARKEESAGRNRTEPKRFV
jgi:hypothetical protein